MRKTFAVLAGLLAAFLIACGSTPPGDPIGTEAGTTTGGAAVATTAAKTAYAKPLPADFTLKLTELSRQCFGSAGCNVTFTVELTKTNTAAVYDPAKSWRVTYTVTGTTDPYSNYLTVTGDQYSHNDTEMVQVKTAKAQLTATVNDVLQ